MSNRMSSDASVTSCNSGSHSSFQNNSKFLAMYLRAVVRRGSSRFFSSGMVLFLKDNQELVCSCTAEI